MCNAWNHPPGCTCGWGGEGHLGGGGNGGGWHSTERESRITRAITSLTSRDFDEFTKTTTCPVCGAEVYFVRHNGGCVWLDSLGWPWPKHPCFDDPDEIVFSTTKKELNQIKVDYFGIVIEVIPQNKSLQYKFKIQCSNNEIIEALFICQSNAEDWIGQLVIVERDSEHITIDNIFLSKMSGKIFTTNNTGKEFLGQFGEALKKALQK